MSACHAASLLLSLQWRTVKHPLESVRPFQFSSVTLADQLELDPANQEGVTGAPVLHSSGCCASFLWLPTGRLVAGLV